MVNSFYAMNLGRFRAETARELGCEESAFDSHALTVVPRPETARYKNLASVKTFGAGTVVCVEPSYLEWTLAHAPKKHYDAFNPSALLVPLAAEAERRGDPCVIRGVMLGFICAELAPEPSLPAGVSVLQLDRQWQAAHRESGMFANALGEPGDVHPDEFWQFGVAFRDAEGVPMAVAGAYDDGPELLEIGVDVHRDHRGKALGVAVVSAISRIIHGRELTATYFCAAANVRSHRTALACGFVPVRTHAGIRKTPQPKPALV